MLPRGGQCLFEVCDGTGRFAARNTGLTEASQRSQLQRAFRLSASQGQRVSVSIDRGCCTACIHLCGSEAHPQIQLGRQVPLLVRQCCRLRERSAGLGRTACPAGEAPQVLVSGQHHAAVIQGFCQRRGKRIAACCVLGPGAAAQLFVGRSQLHQRTQLRGPVARVPHRLERLLEPAHHLPGAACLLMDGRHPLQDQRLGRDVVHLARDLERDLVVR